ncbi:MAG: septum formation initiator family protein [Spirochaetaceae bacterium]|jgi:cell division protein FtsB|nr:septum formation initiator family protein [Spirochaetaceae bacterium]
MKALKYLISLWVGVLVYSFFSLTAGAMGFSAYDQLRKERNKQQVNLDVLQGINRELEGGKDALLYDSNLIAAHARELGYGREDERFIRIVGLSGAKKQLFTPGQIIFAAKPEYMAEKTICLIALAAGFGTLLVLFIAEFIGKRPIGPL